jgi:DNA-directed RNA polymerase subunit beta'
MAVHVPLGVEAQLEAKEIMASDKNILKPGNGDPTVASKLLDIVLGCFWVTKTVTGDKGEGKIFESPEDAIIAHNFGVVGYRAKIKVLPPENSPKYAEFGGKVFETTVGRILFNEILPVDYPFINKEINRDKLSGIIDDLLTQHGMEKLPPVLDKIKSFGFKYATHSGTTWGIDDVVIPKGKAAVIASAKVKSDEIVNQFNEGLLTEEERIRKNIEIWHKTKNEVEKLIPDALDKMGSVYDMVYSKARGSLSQITQMVGMKGLISSTSGQVIEFPIISCSKEGLTPIEYFITTHGSRKGLTDTALNTAKAGYLTRKLFVVAQDVMVSESDCGTKDSIIIKKQTASGIDIPLSKNVRGRVIADDIADASGKVLFKKGHLLSKQDALKVEESGVTSVKVRSPLSCKSVRGVCSLCYGTDLGKNKLVEVGEAVGTVAGQAIGEPGTQLTMRTFHAGGTASQGGDIVHGLPRVEEVFEKRRPKNPAVVATVDGVISEVKDLGKEKVIKIIPELEDRSKGKKGSEIEYVFNYKRTALVKAGDQVKKGDILTDGSADIDDVFAYGGIDKTKEYVINEVGKIYELQGETVSRKHIEIIVRQMFSRKKVVSAGDTDLVEGMIVDDTYLQEENMLAKKEGKEMAKAEGVVMGIAEVSLSRKSFLSAASFQHTTKVLINSAIRGAEDDLVGLMENVIIGRLIPAGTGFAGSEKQKLMETVQPSADIETE